MRSVTEIPVLENIPVLVRVALNVPIQDGVITNDYRLRRILPTLLYLTKHGARIILISHLGEKGTETLEPIARALGALISNVSFCKETVGPVARSSIRDLSPGHILVLENLRRSRGEVENDAQFASEVASLADVFVQDSFDTCHRTHASIVGIPKFLPSYAGLLLVEEIKELTLALSPRHPALAIIGGAKFSTKEPVLAALIDKYDHVFVGGALANDFLKAAGQEVGKSLVSVADEEHVKNLLANQKLIIPLDSTVIPIDVLGSPHALSHARVAGPGEVRPNEIILDHGPATSALLADLAIKAKTVLWNGPLGKYEDGFTGTTDELARSIAKGGSRSVVGGGDTIATIEKLGLLSQFSFVSTGGGAMLDFLAKGTLPGIDALG